MKQSNAFTQASVRTLVMTSTADTFFWDAKLDGFGIRARNGKGRYVVQYRIGTKQRRITLGLVSKLDLDDAKTLAKKYFAQVAEKIDPTVVRAKAELAASTTFGDAIDRYLQVLATKRTDGYVKAVTRALRKRFKCLHEAPLPEITRSMVSEAVAKIVPFGLQTAERSRTMLCAFFNWAIGEGLCLFNPVDGTNSVAEVTQRDRVLSAVELKQIWDALPDNVFGCIVKILILTGQRRTEIGDLRWSEIDLTENLIKLPKARTKNGQVHFVPLSKPAIELLEQCPRFEGQDFVFGSGRGKSGFAGWDAAKKTLDAKLDMPHWTLHDLRRTLGTDMRDQLDVEPHHVEAILNHVSGKDKSGVAGTYNWARYKRQRREALDKYAAYIMQIIGAPIGPTTLKLVA